MMLYPSSCRRRCKSPANIYAGRMMLLVALLSAMMMDRADGQVEILALGAVAVAAVGGGVFVKAKFKKIGYFLLNGNDKDDEDEDKNPEKSKSKKGDGGGGHNKKDKESEDEEEKESKDEEEKESEGDEESEDEDDEESEDEDKNIKYGFLFSTIDNADWCITANNGVRKGALVEMRPCRFSNQPKSQLWSFNKDGQFQSAKDPLQCLMVPENKDYARVKMGPCDSDDDINEFRFRKAEPPAIIRGKGYQNMCLTNKGQKIDKGDTVVVDDCDRTDEHFLFTLHYV
ncbi:expressed unknown protein [Seminavis robusta]|uniref:Ricin B lectin domain-containing protein n=1 Tax=Seminavis robusta TaxID=568900 RepID=A0A9N8DVH7_9STRA|nr:expressed unknown protein [Seminavis robusta]|eukprot:Sro374_g129290.1 n/a (286) ;mRNA; r:55756-56613